MRGRFKTLDDRSEKEKQRIFKPLFERTRFKHGMVPISPEESKEKRYVGNKWLGVRGFDTETTQNGDVYLVSCSHRVNQTDETQTDSIFTTDPYIQFAWLLQKGRHTLNVFWNIGFDLEGMTKGYLKTIPKEKVRESITKNKKKNVFKIPAQGKGKLLTIKYVQGKFFKISDGKHQAYFYDCANFYGHTSLDSASKQHLGYGKEKFGVSNNQIDITKGAKELGYETVRKRCETDATLTRLLFERIYATVMKLGIRPRYWNSPASLSEELLTQKIEEKYLKPFVDCPLHREVLEYGYRSFKGGIFDLRTKGLCDNINEVDIVSAYPDKIARLADLVNGEWKKVTDINPKATFGIYRVRRQFDGFSPYFSVSLGKMVYPVTRDLTEDYLTAPEVFWLRRRGYLVEILDGYEFHHSSPAIYPFSELISQLFEIKNSCKESDKDLYNVAKTIMNAMYGKFVQSNPVLGRLFNSVYGAYITALTRIQIATIAEKHFEEVYEVATDAVIGQLKEEAKIEETENLGGIEVKNRLPSEAVFLQTGLTVDKDGTQFLRNRGIVVEVKSKKKEVEFKEKEVVTKSIRPRHMRECLIQDDLGVESINSFQEVEKRIVYRDSKRIWEIPDPKKEDMFAKKIRSEPLDENFLESLDDVEFVSYIDVLKNNSKILMLEVNRCIAFTAVFIKSKWDAGQPFETVLG
jgi:hypothetical protein